MKILITLFTILICTIMLIVISDYQLEKNYSKVLINASTSEILVIMGKPHNITRQEDSNSIVWKYIPPFPLPKEFCLEIKEDRVVRKFVNVSP